MTTKPLSVSLPYSYQAMLLEELKTRKQRNSKYSLRALAKDLEMSHSFLSEVINKKRTLTENKANEILQNLGWATNKAKLFVKLVQIEKSKSSSLKRKLEAEIKELISEKMPYNVLPSSFLNLLSEWYFDAVYELTALEEFKSSPKWIAKKLDITEAQASKAFQTLIDVGLLKQKNGKYEKATPNVVLPDMPSQALRRFHHSILERAKKANYNQSLKVRKSRVYTMAIDPDRLEEAHKRIVQFCDELTTFLEGGKRRAVYQLVLHLFRADKPNI